MAGITSTFHRPYRTHLFKPVSNLSAHTFSLPLRSLSDTARLPSISGATTISASYGGGGGSSRTSRSDDDDVLDISAIRSDTVRLIDQQQKMVGLVSKAQAFQMAEDAELDLVVLSPDADPPVVRIMDYNLKCAYVLLFHLHSKYRYEQQKKKRDQQKKSAASRMDLKELKMGYNIDVHDYSVRLKAAKKFLKDGDKVKVIVNLKGRENEFRNKAIELLRQFQNDVGELGIEESKNFKERNIFIMLVPNKAAVHKSQGQPTKNEKSAVSEVSAGV